MNNPNDIVQVKHADSITAAIKDFVQNSSGGGNKFSSVVLDSVPQSVNGGLWLDTSSHSPALKLFCDGFELTLATPSSGSRFAVNASLSGNIVTCGNDSFTLTGFDNNLTLLDGKFFDSNQVQVGSLTFNITDCRYEFDFSFDALNINLEQVSVISVSSATNCFLNISGLSGLNPPDLSNGNWNEYADYPASVTGGISLSMYDLDITVGSMSAYIQKSGSCQYVFTPAADGEIEYNVYVDPLFISGQVVNNALSSTAGISFVRSTTDSSIILYLNDRAFGDDITVWANSVKKAGYDTDIFVSILDGDDVDENNPYGKIVYNGNFTPKDIPESLVRNQDGSFTYTHPGTTDGFYFGDSMQTALYGNNNGTDVLKYQPQQGGDSFTLYGFNPALSVKNGVFCLGNGEVAHLEYTGREYVPLIVTSLLALDPDAEQISLVDSDAHPASDGGITYFLQFDSALTTKTVNPASFSFSNGTLTFTSGYDSAYIGAPKTISGNEACATTTAVYHKTATPTSFTITGLSAGLDNLSIDNDDYIFSGENEILHSSSIYVFVRLAAVSSAYDVIKLSANPDGRYKFNVAYYEAARIDTTCTDNGNGSYQFSFSNRCDTGLLGDRTDQLVYIDYDFKNKTLIFNGLRDDLDTLSFDSHMNIKSSADDVIGNIRGNTVTLYENALPERQPVTVTATDGNSYSFTPNYTASLSGTAAADLTLVLPK